MVENTVRLLGVLTKDPATGRTHSLKDRVVLQLATRRRWTNRVGEMQETIDQHRVVVYGPLTHVASPLRRGDSIGISGRLQTRSWFQNGERKFITEVVAEKIRCLGPDFDDRTQPHAVKDARGL